MSLLLLLTALPANEMDHPVKVHPLSKILGGVLTGLGPDANAVTIKVRPLATCPAVILRDIMLDTLSNCVSEVHS